MLDKFEQIARKNISFHIMESRSLRNHCEDGTIFVSYKIQLQLSLAIPWIFSHILIEYLFLSTMVRYIRLNMSRIRYVKDDVDKRKERFPLRSHSFDGSSTTRESFFSLSLQNNKMKTKKRRNFSGSVNVLLLVIKLLYIYINTRIT